MPLAFLPMTYARLRRKTGAVLRTLLHYGHRLRHRPGSLSYRCNVCGQACQSRVIELGREQPSCPRCRSSVRIRAIVHLLSMELFGQSLALPDFPLRPRIKGIGLSDWEAYAEPLAKKLGYTNTFYHQEPRLDITAGVDPALEGTLDFLISSEVFEHVAPPVSVAFNNACRLLKPGGVMIFTVPYVNAPGTVTREHFPDLHRYELVKEPQGYVLKNVTRDGIAQTFDQLVFHGGDGATLEMRVFSERSLLEEFAQAGFDSVKIYREPNFEHGIYWTHSWSLPMTARRRLTP